MLLTDHPDERALYTGVVANPLDDAPRLILADWYEENGFEWRANWIRGIAHAFDNISERQEYEQYTEWYGGVQASLQELGVLFWVFEVGFVNHITISDYNWVRWYAQILQNYPIEVVNIESTPHRCRDSLLEMKYIRGLTQDSHPWLKVNRSFQFVSTE